MTCSKRPGCLGAEQMPISESILNLAISFFKFSKCGMSESEPAAIKTNGGSEETMGAQVRDPLEALLSAVFPVNCASAFSNFVIFSTMFASSVSAISLLWRANTCAANFPMLAGFTMNAFEEPGGLVMQV